MHEVRITVKGTSFSVAIDGIELADVLRLDLELTQLDEEARTRLRAKLHGSPQSLRELGRALMWRADEIEWRALGMPERLG